MDTAINAAGQHHLELELAGARRRWQALDHILGQVRVELAGPQMMQAVLEALRKATGAAGVQLINTGPGTIPPEPGATLHRVGPDHPAVAVAAYDALQAELPGAVQAAIPTGEQVIACRTTTRFTTCPGLVLWRESAAPAWDHDDLALLGVATNVIRIVLEHEAIQNEMAVQARTDPLTGLPNRRAFLDESRRRIDRTVRENTPATLLLLDLDNFKHLNDRLGHDIGDNALLATTDLLRQTFRPTDLIARVAGDEFAVWLDGADAFSSAERAESLCHLIAGELDYQWDANRPDGGGALRLSIGIAMRWPGGEEDIDTLLRQAEQALAAVKQRGGGHWRVFRSEVNERGSVNP